MATKTTATKKAAPKKAAASRATATPKAATTPKKLLAAVRIDPNLPLRPGNSVTFVADAPKGRPGVSVTTNRDAWAGKPSVSKTEARISKIIETGHGTVDVVFTDDGEAYASGTFEVE